MCTFSGWSGEGRSREWFGCKKNEQDDDDDDVVSYSLLYTTYSENGKKNGESNSMDFLVNRHVQHWIHSETKYNEIKLNKIRRTH